MNKHYPGEDYSVKATFQDEEDAFFDPDSHTVYLIDPHGDTRSETTSPTKLGAGLFKATLTIPANGTPGVWTIYWEITYQGEADKEEHRFRVHPSIV